MSRVFIGVGSNIEPRENIRKALELLSREVKILGISTFYRTPPDGHQDQPSFYNGVIEAETNILPAKLKRQILRQIETKLGRRRNEDKYASRTIDLDVLVYDDLTIATDEITVPDPLIAERSFLVIPLCELAPDLQLPGTDCSIRDAAIKFAQHNMEPLPEFTEELRKDIL